MHVTEISIDEIFNNPFQPRNYFDSEKLSELAESIKIHGILEPVIVVKAPEGYRLVAGERRTRAAKLAGFKAVPAIVRDFSSQEIVELALIENIQRQDLNPLEEAEALSFLINEFKLTHKEAASRIGRSRSYITNCLRILALPDAVKKDLAAGGISFGHARALLALNNERAEIKAWIHIKKNHLSVRKAESYISSILDASGRKAVSESVHESINSDWEELLDGLRLKFNADIRLHETEKGKGRLEFVFQSYEELEKLAENLVNLLE